jgi:NAD(P)-dependent dehydrogenase (short-subunit alcohol dehydrogenase family)
VSPELLRTGLLAGVSVAVAGEGELGRAVAARAAALEARLAETEDGASDVLVWDGAAAFASAPGVEGVRAALDGAWLAVRPVATDSWIARGEGGLIVLLAPPPGDAHAEAARAGLENLARTLSIEWSRFGIRPVAILPGERTAAGEVAELAAYLASPAGGYFSGCAFTLGAA